MYVDVGCSKSEKGGGAANVWNVWGIHPLGRRVSDYFCAVLPACSRLWSRWCWLLSSLAVLTGSGWQVERRRLFHVRRRCLWGIHPLGGCVFDYFCVVHSTGSLCRQYHLHHNSGLLMKPLWRRHRRLYGNMSMRAAGCGRFSLLSQTHRFYPFTPEFRQTLLSLSVYNGCANLVLPIVGLWGQEKR